MTWHRQRTLFTLAYALHTEHSESYGDYDGSNPMAHTLPPLSTVEPAFTATYHGQIKTWLEEITQSNPFVQVDWTAYQTVLSWASRA